MNKRPVTISLSSRQEDDGQAETTHETHQGTFYEREGASYLLFADEATSTTLRIEADEIRLYRRGEVSSWQIFQLGELTGGLLTLGASEMILRIMTSHFRVLLAGESGRIELHYELLTGETPDPADDPTTLSLGKFVLSIDWHAAS